jgi:GST-like protein
MPAEELTLYGCPGSGSAAIEMALRHAGVPYRVVRAASWEPGPGLDDLARINPLKQVPTLVLADGTVLSESAAILIHLGLEHPQLLPPAQRARALRGLVFIAANCYSAVSVSDFPERWTATPEDEASVEAVRQAARAQLHLAWQRFADLFFAPGERSFLSGDAPGALDFLAVVVSKWSGTRPALKRQRPEFHQFLEQLQKHPAVAGVHAEHWPH